MGDGEMPLNDKFTQLLQKEVNAYRDDLLLLRESLIKFKNDGMDKETMLENLEKLRTTSDPETEDIFLELMDFVVGYCSPHLSVF
jgi:DNA-binding SARP family transcriptional activator